MFSRGTAPEVTTCRAIRWVRNDLPERRKPVTIFIGREPRLSRIRGSIWRSTPCRVMTRSCHSKISCLMVSGFIYASIKDILRQQLLPYGGIISTKFPSDNCMGIIPSLYPHTLSPSTSLRDHAQCRLLSQQSLSPHPVPLPQTGRRDVLCC